MRKATVCLMGSASVWSWLKLFSRAVKRRRAADMAMPPMTQEIGASTSISRTCCGAWARVTLVS
jgi:hypothetical protein